LAKNLGISPTSVKHAQIAAQEVPPEISDEVKKNRMAINKAYKLTKGKPDNPAKVIPETDKENIDREYDRTSVSGEADQPMECPVEPDNDRLEQLELWVHWENLNIPREMI
jgi:hypothetical protein